MLNQSNLLKVIANTALIFIFSLFLVACGGGGSGNTNPTTPPNTNDTIAPVITLAGSSTITLLKGANYIDAGATATDNIDGDITSNIITGGDAVNTNAIGIYSITYNVKDNAQNPAIPIVRTVTIKTTPPINDIIAPAITLIGSSSINLTKGSNYIDAGATAFDNIDGNISARIIKGGDSVNTNIVGTYTITYNVKDRALNSAIQKTRTITINPAKFSYIEMHYDLLKGQSLVWGENENIHNISLSNFSARGSTTLNVTDNSSLLQNQLITYLSTNGSYYITKIQSLPNPHQIIVSDPLKGPINAGNNAWNFYANSSHANTYGFKAIADYSIKSLGFGAHTGGKHVLLGDSWFDENSIYNRLKQKLTGATIINEGIGGNTLQDLINRFDSDVTPHAPEYVWIMSGTNDYWKGVSTAQFKINLSILINKSKAIGAKVIIFDSSVGVGTGATGIPNQFQSEEYVRVLKELNQ